MPGGALAPHPPAPLWYWRRSGTTPQPLYGIGGTLAPHPSPSMVLTTLWRLIPPPSSSLWYWWRSGTALRPSLWYGRCRLLRGWPRRGGAALLTRPGPARRRAAAAILYEPPAGQRRLGSRGERAGLFPAPPCLLRRSVWPWCARATRTAAWRHTISSGNRPCTNASFRPGAARPGPSLGPAVSLPGLVGRLQSRVIPRHRIRASDRGFGAFLRLWGQRGAGCGLRPCSGPAPDPSGPQSGDSVLVCFLFSPAPPPGGFAGAAPAMGPAPASGSSDPELPNLSWCNGRARNSFCISAS